MRVLLLALSKPLGGGGGFFLHFSFQVCTVTFEQAIPRRRAVNDVKGTRKQQS